MNYVIILINLVLHVNIKRLLRLIDKANKKHTLTSTKLEIINNHDLKNKFAHVLIITTDLKI